MYNSFVHPEMRHRCSEHNKWIINIFLNKWYHSYKMLIRYQIVNKNIEVVVVVRNTTSMEYIEEWK